MTALCPHCGKTERDFKAVEMPEERAAKEPWVLLADGPCPSCGWRAGIGRFKTKAEAEAFIPAKAEAA